MRRSFLLIGLLLFVTAFSACATESSRSPVEGTLTIPNSFGFGGSDDGIQVQFLRVENDSRCAAGVQCIRAGEAFVVLRTTVDNDPPVESRIEMAPGGESILIIDRFKVTLLKLLPDPPPLGGVEQDEYEILLRIEES